MQKGLLLINLGTPDSTELADIKRYLKEFLTDKRVIDLPSLVRYILVYGIIVPFRSKKTAHSYQSIWTKAGSPLMTHSQDLVARVQAFLGDEYRVVLGMRYGNPSIKEALSELKTCADITVIPLYPQYSSAATGSSLEEVMRIVSEQEVLPSLKLIRDFYHQPAYIAAQAGVIRQHLSPKTHLLLSYHGIPERQIIKSGCASICSGACAPMSLENQGCYRAQCFATSRFLAQELNLNEDEYTTSFQSRLGKTPWIRPYTDEILSELIARGIRRLAVACPAFVADCLETLEEIGLRLKEQWLELGGTEYSLIPCLNSDPAWVEAVGQIVKSDKPAPL